MTEALKSSIAVRRFIVVQQDAQALFGLFSVGDGESIEAKAVDSVKPWTDHPEQGMIKVLDTDASAHRGLTVYEVPADFLVYDETDTSIDASSVNDGQLFENFRDFALVGNIVEAPENENIRVLVETSEGEKFFVETSTLDVETDEDWDGDRIVSGLFTITGPGVDGVFILMEEWIDEDGDVERMGGRSRWSTEYRSQLNDLLPSVSENAVDEIWSAIADEIEYRKL